MLPRVPAETARLSCSLSRAVRSAWGSLRPDCRNWPGRGIWGWLCILGVGVAASGRLAADELRLLLHDGRTVIASDYNSKTNEQTLVISVAAPGIDIRRSLRWDSIKSVTLNGNVYSGRLFRAGVLQMLREARDQEATEREIPAAGLTNAVLPVSIQRSHAIESASGTVATTAAGILSPIHPLPTGDGEISPALPPLGYNDCPPPPCAPWTCCPPVLFPPTGVPFVNPGVVIGVRRVLDLFPPFPLLPPPCPPPPLVPLLINQRDKSEAPIMEIAVDAVPIRSHGRLDWDALELRVTALDPLGNPVPFAGVLQATLWGQQQELVRSVGRSLIGDPIRIAKIGHWTRNVHPFAPGVPGDPLLRTQGTMWLPGAVLQTRLPLPASSPEHNSGWHSLGDLSVELSVPGQGVYAAQVAAVPLRQFSPLRDDLFEQSGSRFFSGELLHGRRRVAGPGVFLNSTSRPNSPVFSVQP